MRPVLALDLATTLGWAWGPPGTLQHYGSHRIQGSSHGAFFSAFDGWLSDLITTIEPREIIMEAPFSGGVRNANTARKLMGLVNIADLVAYRREIRISEVNNSTLKKYWTGSGRAQKPDMIHRCQVMGFDPQDDNAADAIACWHYACDLIEQSRQAREINRKRIAEARQ